MKRNDEKPPTKKKGKAPDEPQPAFERESLPRELRPFVDEHGKLAQWPSKQKTQRMAAVYLASKLEQGRTYNEKQVNELLNEWHTFEDWALLRRVMFDWGYLDRESDGSKYWVRGKGGSPGQPSDSASANPA